MSGIAKRFRWPLVLLSISLIVVLIPLAWRFRPLNAVERKLVGTWRRPSVSEHPAFVVLRPDRRIQTLSLGSFSPAGQWSASGSDMTYALPARGLRGDIEWLLGKRPWPRYRMRIGADDAGSPTLTNLELGSITWHRHTNEVPEEPPESVVSERPN